MWRPDERVKETVDIDFGSTSNDNLEPRGTRGGVGQSPQDAWTSESVATLINCVDDKDESTFGRARKFADELKEKKSVSSTMASDFDRYAGVLPRGVERGGTLSRGCG